jgi:hypothetical protein
VRKYGNEEFTLEVILSCVRRWHFGALNVLFEKINLYKNNHAGCALLLTQYMKNISI